MFDKLEVIGKSVIQHGPNNNRVYLMKLHPDDLEGMIDYLFRLAIAKGMPK
ncbi:MAG: hypothetical protein HC819_13765 [Cyclobacteriaceae bacterium]|nr:hypothetical protein [Cyclobacteriaceae bacterium]